jgi:hypothetical protein
MIDFGLVYIASLALRTLLPEYNSNLTLYAVFVLSFLTSIMMLSFKIADTSYDMLLSLLFPIIKFLPFIISVRNSFTSAMEFKQSLMGEREHINQGRLITLYRLHATFLDLRRGLIAHYVLTIVLGIFIAILAQRPYWMLAQTLLMMAQTITLSIIAMIMYPTNWMSEETYKVEHQMDLGEVARIRG